MKISIITITHNRAEIISRALSSINNQTYNDIQKVIVDGLSTDNTINLVKPNLKKNDVLISELDNGIYDALNKGIMNSEGEVIAFLHSDDLYEDKNVIKQVMNTFRNQDVDIVYGNAIFFSKLNIEKITRKYKSYKLSKKNLAWGKMPAHCAIFIKKKIFNKIGLFDTKYKIAGDYEFLCRLVMNYNFKAKYIPKTFIRMQSGGVSNQGFKSLFTLNRETYQAILKNGIYTNIFMLLSKYFFKIKEFF